MAEDVFQEVSILAVRKREDIASLAHLPAWLRKSAKFEALNALRKQQRDPLVFNEKVLDLIESEWAGFDHKTADMLNALERCMGELSDYARDLLRQRYRENLTGQSLAQRMGRPMNTVYVALSRAHSALAECMQRRTSAHS